MSGGVDSSVAAALLKKQGYDVTGVFMKPWQPTTYNLQPTTKERGPKSLVVGSQLLVSCLWQQDREDAMRVASKIGIPLLTWDFSKEYKKEVADYMIREYRAGRTPNPDVMCNSRIKFGVFLEHALRAGADYIATGHYVRLMRKSQNTKPKSQTNSKPVRPGHPGGFKNKFENCKLKIAKDKNKDQSYFLWTLTQKQLKYCLFPIGDYKKPEVRKMANKLGLSTADKKDSQGVCFIGPLDMKNFLQKYIKPKRGKIFDMDGNSLGEHDGVFYYTIGQRHGLNIKEGRGPYYVVKKNLKKNIVYVGSRKDLLSQKLKLININWINRPNQPVDKRQSSPRVGDAPLRELAKSFIRRGEELNVRTRYRAPLSKAVIKNNGEVVFKKKETAITPGQSAVFYRGEEMLGGGIITE